MAALMGVTIALEPALAFLGLLIGTGAMLLLWRSPLRGAGALSTCFMVILGISQYYQIDRDLVMGLVASGHARALSQHGLPPPQRENCRR